MSIKLTALASGNCGNDAHLVTWFYDRLGVLKKPNIFVIHKDVYESANVILVIANPFFQTGVALFQVVDEIPDRRTFDLNDFLILGQFAKRSWNTDWYRHND